MIGLASLWAHAVAAALYSALALWTWHSGSGDRRARTLSAAFLTMAVWAAAQALVPHAPAAWAVEAARNVAFLSFMHILRRGTGPRSLSFVYAAVAAVAGLQFAVALVPAIAPTVRDSLAVTLAAGALVLVHNLYAQATRGSRWGIRLPALALAMMWGIDFHLYTVSYVTQGPVDDLLALRGIVAVMLVPLFAVATRRNSGWRVQLSRTATFRSLSMVALAAYFVAMLTLARAAAPLAGDWARLAQAAFILLTVGGALLILPSRRARARLHVLIAKHLFEHRYDYREDWLRFSRTIGGAEPDRPVAERLVKALAELAGAPGGLMLDLDDAGRFTPGARWNWQGAAVVDPGPQTDLASWLGRTGIIIAFDMPDPRFPSPVPVQAGAAWAGVPIIHGDRLLGLVLLARPDPVRPLDWEDFDLLKAAGSQAASHLAEAHGQAALGEARRFDEFNRRFAFIMHDIKNLVSQLSLVARNAERHAANPDFQADMIATLHASVKKMNHLLARLPREVAGEGRPLAPVPIRSLLTTVAEPKRRLHPVEVAGDPALHALGDWARLEQAIGHLVQNAIEASGPGVPVLLSAALRHGEVVVEVRDRGRGMSPDFVACDLFKPFLSTKEGGFGIGAYEARSLVAALGGRLQVESAEGQGTTFTIHLTPADAGAAAPERISA